MTLLALSLGWRITFGVLALVIGILVAGWIGVCDMCDNFETGYGPESKKCERRALASIVAGLLIGLTIFFFAGCDLGRPPEAHSTPAPAKTSRQNAGKSDQNGPALQSSVEDGP
jgi:hypothetical protein